MRDDNLLQNIPYPFPGLRPFERHESPIFFGRGAEIERMLSKLEDHRLLAVVGASGSGKSSLVRAGLLPALEGGFFAQAREGWQFVIMRPGEDPFVALANAIHTSISGTSEDDDEVTRDVISFSEATLRSGPLGLDEALKDVGLSSQTNVLVLVDQFEEIFRISQLKQAGRKKRAAGSTTAYADTDDASDFVSLLLDSVKQSTLPIYVVITMRSDFLGDCDIFAGLPEAINDCQLLTPRLGREQLQDAINGPLDLFDDRAEPGLVNRILNDVGNDPDQLPLMQHAVMRIWRKARDDSTNGEAVLHESDYESVGGLEEALSKHADAVYEQLDERSQRVAEIMFRCLCERTVEGRSTRRPVRVSEVAAAADIDADTVVQVADAFMRPGRTFIMSTSPGPLGPDTMLDISHEVLIRQWKKLGQWLDDEATSASLYRRLLDTAQLWKEGNAGLWSSPDLEIAQEWREKNEPNATWAERYGGQLELALEFVETSVKAQRAERRRRRRQVISMAVAVILALLTLGFGGLAAYAVWERDRANTESERANTERARAVRSNYSALLTQAHGRWRNYPNVASRILEEAGIDVAGDEQSPRSFKDFARHVYHRLTRTSPALVSETSQQSRSLRDFAWGVFHRLARTGPPGLSEKVGPIYCLAASDRFLASAGQDGVIRFYDAQATAHGNRVLVGEWKTQAESIYVMAFHSASNTLAWAGPDGKIWIREVAAGGQLPSERMLSGHTKGRVSRVNCLAFSSDGRLLACGANDHAVRIRELRSGRLLQTLEGHRNRVASVEFSPDGERLASASHDNTIRLWNTQTWSEQVPPLRGHTQSVLSVTFSPDGKTLVSAGDDKTIRLWDTDSGSEKKPTLNGHSDSVVFVAFAPNGQTLASASDDTTIKLWDTETWQERITLSRHFGSVYSVVFLSDGKSLASASGDGTVKIWDVDQGIRMDQAQLQRTVDAVHSVAFISKVQSLGDEMNVATSASSPNTMEIRQMKYVTASDNHDGTISWFESAESFAEPTKVAHHQQGVNFLAVHPDASIIATAGNDSTVRLWEFETGKQLPTSPLSGHTGRVNCVAFSLDGMTVASAGSDRTIRLWNTAEGSVVESPLEGHTDEIMCVAFHPDGQLLVTGGNDSSVRLWNARDGSLLNAFKAHDDSVLHLSFSPDGETLATCSEDESIKLWNVNSLRELSLVSPTTPEPLAPPLVGHSGAVTYVVFSPDRRTLVSAGVDRTIRLWDPQLGYSRAFLSGHQGSVQCLSFSANGQLLVSAADDDTVRFWMADDFSGELKSKE